MRILNQIKIVIRFNHKLFIKDEQIFLFGVFYIISLLKDIVIQ